jgi:hypothetical protein
MRQAVIAALFLFTLAGPAGAQIAGRHDYGDVGPSTPNLGDSSLRGPGTAREMRDIRGRIEDARDSGRISRREARQLERESRRIGRAARRYGRDGLSPSEARELQQRALILRGLVTAARPKPEAERRPRRG